MGTRSKRTIPEIQQIKEGIAHQNAPDPSVPDRTRQPNRLIDHQDDKLWYRMLVLWLVCYWSSGSYCSFSGLYMLLVQLLVCYSSIGRPRRTPSKHLSFRFFANLFLSHFFWHFCGHFGLHVEPVQPVHANASG